VKDVAGVALVGAGFISYFHVLSLRTLGTLQLRAVASRSEAVAQHRARLFAAEAYTFDELPALLARRDVDIVIIESPVYLHAAHATAALAAGKHVIIEKPLVRTLAEADDVQAAALAAGCGVGYAENQVFTPLALRARELVAAGAVGRVRRVNGVFKHGGPPAGSWFWNPRLAGGGAHLDLGSHALETALFLAGTREVKRVRASRIERDGKGGVDVTAEVEMETPDGVEVRTESSWVEPRDACAFEVTGDDGSLRAVFSPVPQSLCVCRGAVEESFDVPGQFDLRFDALIAGMGYAGQMRHFAECFARGETPRESVSDGARVLRILAAGYLAAARSAAVEVAEVPRDRAPIELLTD